MKKPFSSVFHQLTFAYCAVRNCVCVFVRARAIILVLLSFFKIRGQIKSGRLVRLKLDPPPPPRHGGVLPESPVRLFLGAHACFRHHSSFAQLTWRVPGSVGAAHGGSRLLFEGAQALLSVSSI